jgi:hypothetical protein
MLTELFCIIIIFSMFKVHKNLKMMLDPTNTKNFLTMYKEIFSFLYALSSSFLFKAKEYEKKCVNKKLHLKIPYTYKGNNYYYLLKIPKGVEPISDIVDENEKDIAEAIKPYLGPNLDCNGVKMTPEDFGYEKIKIRTVMDRTVVFDKGDYLGL